MTYSEAKEVLKLYRPGTADADDPEFAEALAQCERDAELKKWFGEHCALYSAMRAKFKQIAVPEGLKEQIIAERKVHTGTVPMWQKAVLAVGAVAAIALIFFQISTNWKPKEPTDFAHFSEYIVGNTLRGYNSMDTNTSNLDAIRQFLAQTNDIADYDLPVNLQKNAQPAGCVATKWQGKKVSMICFQTGRPLKPNRPSDLWLFVIDRSSATDSPTSAKPMYKQGPEPGVITASWTVGNRSYVLATEGDQKFLEQFL
jgi:hypothetical protein